MAKRCQATGRVVTLDEVAGTTTGKAAYRVAAPGEVVPRSNQFLVPSKKHMGRNWGHFVQALRDLGYAVQWRVICNADLGAHSTRTRLYMIARCDGLPIVWPEQTHAKKPKPGQARHRPAADCIDWSIPGKSIFGRDKPLAEATMRRIAHGMERFVLKNPQPFIVKNIAATLVQMGHGQGSGKTTRRSYGANSITGPLGTVTASGGGHGIAAATLVQMGYGERPGQAPRVPGLDKPLGTIVAGGGKHGLTTAFMVQANGGFNATPARAMDTPLSTVTTSGSQQQLCTLQLSQDDEAGAMRCAAFLMRYHGNGGQWSDLREPMTTITTRDRLALVTVWLKGEPWVIVDITLRMLVPRELYNAQDFPPNYVIDRTAAGKPLTKTAQVRMAGNSVSPLPMRLIVAANYTEAQAQRRAA